MQYDYDYFISYAHADNESEDHKSGFVDKFVEKLKKNDSEEHERIFGREIEVFFDKDEIPNMSTWETKIRAALASSRFLIVLMSPNYFQSKYCAKEFDWWMKHEMHRCTLGDGTAPILIIDVAYLKNENVEPIPAIPPELHTQFPNWLSRIRKIQSNFQFDLHHLLISKIDEVLRTLCNDVKEKVRHQDIVDNLPYDTYLGNNENFVGRRESLLALREYMTSKNGKVIAALTGLGGFGKTELALTYGHAFGWDYQMGRFFISCENRDTVYEAILKCGIQEKYGWTIQGSDDLERTLSLFNRLKEEKDKIIHRNQKPEAFNDEAAKLRARADKLEAENRNEEADRLRTTAEKFELEAKKRIASKIKILPTEGAHLLIILDNIDNLDLVTQMRDLKIPDFIHIIVTTQKNTKKFPYVHTEIVDKLSYDEAVELLNNLRLFGNLEEAEAARKIAKLLDGFTLAVELTGAYLANNECLTYQDHYKQLASDCDGVSQIVTDELSAEESNSNESHKVIRHPIQTIATVIKSPISKLTPLARQALKIASLMPPDAVALSWIPELLGLDYYKGKIYLSELSRYYLLTPLKNEPNIARMHRMVAKTALKEIEEGDPKEIVAKIRAKCEDLLKKDKTFWCTSENSWNVTPVSEFCLALAEQWKIEESEDEIDWNLTNMLRTSGEMLRALGKMNEAKRVFQILSEISEQRVKKFSSNVNAKQDLSASLQRIAELDKELGNTEQARKGYAYALKINQDLANQMPNNAEAQQTASDIKNKLGLLEQDAGNIIKAREWYENALGLSPNQAEKNQEKVYMQRAASAINNRLGDMEKIAQTPANEQTQYIDTLGIDQPTSDKVPDNIGSRRGMSNSLNNLAKLEKSSGNTEQAKQLLETSLEIQKHEVELTPDDVDAQRNLSITYNDLAAVEATIGNTDKARELFNISMGISKDLADKLPNDVDTQQALGNTYNKYGDMERAEGNTDSARSMYIQAVGIAQDLANKMPDNVTVLRNLSEYFCDLGNLEISANNANDAKNWSNRALLILEPLVDKMPDDVESRQILAKVYCCIADSEIANGNVSSSQSWYIKAEEVFQHLANKMPDNAEVQRKMAETHEKLAQTQKFLSAELGDQLAQDQSGPWYVTLFRMLFRMG